MVSQSGPNTSSRNLRVVAMLTLNFFIGGLLVVSLVYPGMAQFDFGGFDGGDDGDDDGDDDGGGGGGGGNAGGGGGGFDRIVQQGSAILSGFSNAFSPQLVQSLARFYLTFNGVLNGTETSDVASLLMKPGTQLANQINNQRESQQTNSFRSPGVSQTLAGNLPPNIIQSAYVTQGPPSFPQMTIPPSFLQQHGQQLVQSLLYNNNLPPSLPPPPRVPPRINFPGVNPYPLETPKPPMTTNLKIPTILLSPPVEQVTPENVNFIGNIYPSVTGSSLSQTYFFLPTELSTQNPFPQFNAGNRKDIPSSGLVGISSSSTTTLPNSEELTEEEEDPEAEIPLSSSSEIETSTSTVAPVDVTTTNRPLPILPPFSQRLMQSMRNSSGPAFWMNRFYPFGIGNVTFTTMRPRRRRRKTTTAETTTTTKTTTPSPDEEYYEEYEEEEENPQGSSTMKSRKKRKKNIIKISLKSHNKIP